MSFPVFCSSRKLLELLVLFVFALAPVGVNAETDSEQLQQLKAQVDELRTMVTGLQSRVTDLEQRNSQLQMARRSGPDDAAALHTAALELRGGTTSQPALVQTNPPTAQATVPPAASPLPGTLPGGATLNYYFDGYFENNFNNPTGRVNDLRAYDVLSRTFSINQADFIFALDPDVSAHRRYGMRIDLQFGQATETLQGNPANEPRPEIYRNLFQAYGTYVVPLGSGLNFDFGKWASSLGMEGNYTKDQINYSRSYYFYFLPFYHQGVRLHYNFTAEACRELLARQWNQSIRAHKWLQRRDVRPRDAARKDPELDRKLLPRPGAFRHSSSDQLRSARAAGTLPRASNTGAQWQTAHL